MKINPASLSLWDISQRLSLKILFHLGGLERELQNVARLRKKSTLDRVSGSVSDFWSDRSGSPTIIFAMSALPAILLVAFAADYARQTQNVATLQSAADQVALALTRTLTTSTTANSLRTPAQSMLSAYAQTNAAITLGTLTLSNNNSQLCLSATQPIPNTLTSKMLRGTPTVSATSCAAAQGSGTFEIALVMDTTGSMGDYVNSQTKLYWSQQAAKNLIAQLNPSGKTPMATFTVVPFSTSVNVGTGYASASWMDTTGASSQSWQNYTRPSGTNWPATSRFDLFSKMGATWAGCVEERADPYLVTDVAATSSTPATLFVPYLWPDEGDVAGSGSATLPGAQISSGWWGYQTYNSSNWDINGSNTLNNYLYDFGGTCASTNDAATQADVADPISQGSGWTKSCKYKNVTGVSSSVSRNGPNYACNSQSLVTLTQDSSTLNNKIDALSAGGDTNLLTGLMWGWRTISPNGPFTSATTVPKAYNTYGNTKVIVFLTDGMNTWQRTGSNYGSEYNALGYFANNRLSAYGGTTYPAPDGSVNSSGSTTRYNYRNQMDAAVLAACNNAKNAGIIVYTVGFSISGAEIDTAGQNLLQACATDSSHSFIATDSTSVLSSFAQIGAGLGKLRLVQ